MPMDESVRKAVLAAVPSLRAFAISLCGNVDRADDLVQETVLRSLRSLEGRTEEVNLRAWCLAVLRNIFHEHLRRHRREAARQTVLAEASSSRGALGRGSRHGRSDAR